MALDTEDMEIDGKAFRQRLEDALSTSASPPFIFFQGAARGELLSRLEHLCQFSDLLLLVCADEENGKTTLFHEFLNRQNDEVSIARLDSPLTTTIIQLSELLQKSAGVDDVFPIADVGQLLRLLQQYMRQSLMLVIDDAHALSGEAWHFLLQLIEQSRSVGLTIRVVAFADPAVRSTLELCGSSQQVHLLEVPELDIQDANDYLKLQQASGRWSELVSLPANFFPQLIEQSHGRIGAIDRMLQEQNNLRASGSTKGFGLPKAHMWALIAVVTLLTFSYIAQGLFDNAEEEPVISSTAIEVEAEPVLAVEDVREKLLLEAQEVMARQSESPPVEVVSVPEDMHSDEQQGVIETVIVANNSAEKSDKTSSEKLADKVPETDLMIPTKITTAEVKSSEPSGEAISKPQANKPVMSPEKAVTKLELTASAQWLTAQSSDAYSLQMLGSHSKPAVEAFIARMGSGKQWHLIETRHQDKPWFIALYGSYASRAAATKAIDAMSPALKAQKPWARALGPLKKTLPLP